MNSPSFRFEARSGFRWTALLGAVVLLALTGGVSRSLSGPAGAGRTIRVHGHRLKMGMAPPRPTSGDEEKGGEGDERARLLRWIESRHRAAPGVDWRAIEAANREAALARLEAKAGGPKPVWHERGPVNMAGATSATAVRPDGKTLLIGSVLGGVFSGVPGAQVWAPLNDSFGRVYLKGLVVAPAPEAWVAAAEAGLDSAVYVSRNHGATWTRAKGLADLVEIDEMIQDGGDRRTVYLLAETENATAARRILARSRDGGLTFRVVQSWSVDEQPGIWTSRTGAGPLYLMMDGQLQASTDHGDSFSPRGQAIDPRLNVAYLRGSEAGAPTFYAVVGQGYYATDLYASDDGGLTWEKRFAFGSSPVNRNSLAVSITNPDLILYGFVNAMRSADGGRSFAAINDWTEYYDQPASKLHADVRALDFFLYRGRETLFLGTDGGTYQSTDGGATVANLTLNGLGNAELYSTWSSATNPDGFVAGSQDQGFQESLPTGGRPGAPLGTVQRFGGDYGNLTSATHDLTNVFAVYPGALFDFAPGGDTSSVVSVPLPTAVGAFFQATAADPDDPSTVYVGGDHIWRMTYEGRDGFAESQLPQSFSSGEGDYVVALAIAPSDHRVWYAATAGGHLWSSRDHGSSWSVSATAEPVIRYQAFTTLQVSPVDPLTCFAGGSGYSASSVLVTHDGGGYWSPLTKGLPQTLVWAFAFDGTAAHTLYAATDAGPYVLTAANSTWRSLLGGGAPVIPYTSVEGVPAAHLVRFGTYGRGVWDYVVPGGR
jgi:hypothetical protein